MVYTKACYIKGKQDENIQITFSEEDLGFLNENRSHFPLHTHTFMSVKEVSKIYMASNLKKYWWWLISLCLSPYTLPTLSALLYNQDVSLLWMASSGLPCRLASGLWDRWEWGCQQEVKKCLEEREARVFPFQCISGGS